MNLPMYEANVAGAAVSESSGPTFVKKCDRMLTVMNEGSGSRGERTGLMHMQPLFFSTESAAGAESARMRAWGSG